MIDLADHIREHLAVTRGNGESHLADAIAAVLDHHRPMLVDERRICRECCAGSSNYRTGECVETHMVPSVCYPCPTLRNLGAALGITTAGGRDEVGTVRDFPTADHGGATR